MRQMTIVHKGSSYTFHTNDRGIYETSHPYASPRNVQLLRAYGLTGSVSIESFRDKHCR